MTEKTLTTENIKPALDALRGELAPWPVVAKKQDRLNTAQLNAANSGITSSLVAQIIANTAAIRALESAITGTGLRALVVSSLPAIGTQGILYIVPVTTYDPETDADVVNYSNEYLWIPVEGGTASEGHYEQVGQTGIVINNGQLTITVNGTSVGTFTANQSGDTTAAITVPTNADYVDRTTDQTVAGVKTFSSTINGTAAKAIADEDGTSIKTGYVNVAGNQTVTGNKEFTGSNTFNSILPNATNTYSLGSSSYQWSSVYAQSYYYNGTAWGLDKANVWSAENTYTNTLLTLKHTALEVGVLPASNQTRRYRFTDKNNADLGWVQHRVTTSGDSYLEILSTNKFSNGQFSPQGSDVANSLIMGLRSDGKRYAQIMSDFFPAYTNLNCNLGTSTNQWKSVYAQSYYYNGTQWGLDKANTWTTYNTFTGNIRPIRLRGSNNDIYNVQPQSSVYSQIDFVDKNDETMSYILFQHRADATETHRLCLRQKKITSDAYYSVNLNNLGDFYPEQNNAINLGTSTNKWKTLNGVNPGALSLPDINTSIAVDTTNWVYDGATFNEIKINNATQTISGWLYTIINNASSDDVIVVRYAGSDSGNLTYAQYKSGLSYVSLVAPIMPGVKTYVASRKAFSTIKIYSCLGNV